MAKKTVSKEIRQLNEVVLDLLKSDERLRDSDRKLSARIWTIQLGGYPSAKQMTAYEFFTAYVADESSIFSQESIGRARRLVQQEHPELRGKRWNERQDEQNNVIQEVKPFTP